MRWGWIYEIKVVVSPNFLCSFAAQVESTQRPLYCLKYMEWNWYLNSCEILGTVFIVLANSNIPVKEKGEKAEKWKSEEIEGGGERTRRLLSKHKKVEHKWNSQFPASVDMLGNCSANIYKTRSPEWPSGPQLLGGRLTGLLTPSFGIGHYKTQNYWRKIKRQQVEPSMFFLRRNNKVRDPSTFWK